MNEQVAKDFQELQKAIKQIQKEFGQSSAFLLGQDNIVECEFIPIDSLKLSRVLGGGIPRGKIIEVFGWESSGKTTIASYLVGQAQKAGYNCAFIDAEHAFAPSYAKVVGLDTDKLVFTQPNSGEEALTIAEKMIDTIPNLGVIVIDSIASLVPQAEIDGDMGDAHMALQARLLSQAMRKLTGKLERKKVTLIAINQLRMKIGVMYGNPETTSGGNALKFYSSIRLDVRRREFIQEEKNEMAGITIRVKAVKNKVATPMREDILELNFKKGFDAFDEIVDFAVHYGIIQKGGAWYTVPNVEEKVQGKNRVVEYYKENKEELFEIKEKIIKLMKGDKEDED